MSVIGYAAQEAKGELKPFEFDLSPLLPDEVEIDVLYCGICHSDLSMLNNDWRMTSYPFIPGHEVVGKIAKKGESVIHLEVGQTVGLGWTSRSCLTCDHCMGGDHQLCTKSVGTIVGRYGGFASKVKAQAAWTIPIPEGIDLKAAGPLFCGGITVFDPIIQNNISALSRVGVVGIGGLGHMAIRFLNAWGCEVTAFSTSTSKEQEVRNLGAHHFVNLKETDAIKKARNSLDMILVTSNVDLDWNAYLAALKPKGKLHIVGAVGQVNFTFFPMLGGQKSISGSPTGSPLHIKKMLEFTALHDVHPIVETYKMADVNEALEKLHNGKPRYRLVLEA